MELDDIPMLNVPNVTLVALKAAAHGPAEQADCAQLLARSMREAGVDWPEDDGPLQRRIANAYRRLLAAQLVQTDAAGRFVITTRGCRTLEEHPTGIDSSVLSAFPEYEAARRVDRPKDQRQPEGQRQAKGAYEREPRPEYLEGFHACLRGSSLTDNPYGDQSAAKQEWQYGWSEANEHR